MRSAAPEAPAPTGSSPARSINYGASEVDVRPGVDGVLHMTQRHPLPPFPDRVTQPLEHWARAAPDRTFLAQRGPDGDWRRISYAEMLARVEAVAEGLLACHLSAERPIVTLSANTIEHAVLLLAAQHAGIPIAPLTPAYGAPGSDFARLRHVMRLLTPGLIHVEDAAHYADALAAIRGEGLAIVADCNADAVPGCRALEDLGHASPAGRLRAATARVGPDTIAKFLFTSGSTGLSKAVINTHRMLCANQAQLAHIFAFVRDAPPVMVDWLPWSHTAGGNHNFNLVLFNGGTMHIDDGRPVRSQIGRTIRNLREISPTLYFNVPVGFAMLVEALDADEALRRSFFRNMQVMWYAAAAMPQATWAALDDLAIRTVGARVAMVTGLGMTETAPAATMSTPDMPIAGAIGLPAPGVEVKLVPFEDSYEIRFRGPNVMPGYWRDAETTARAFDGEGYYRTGDAVRLADPGAPDKGLIFEGRITENFKLATGTWVRVSTLRDRLLEALGGLAADLVIAAPDRPDIRVLVFPNLEACRRLSPALAEAEPAAVIADPAVRGAVHARLRAVASRASGSSGRVAAALLLDTPPSAAAGEVTEKGTINQRGVLRLRAAAVEALYAGPPGPGVIMLD